MTPSLRIAFLVGALLPLVASAEESAAAAVDERRESLLVSTFFEKQWELAPEYKRGTFTVRTYAPNFFLPVHYTTRVNDVPSSPTREARPADTGYKHVGAKLQISLRTKALEDFLLPQADVWLGYTQRSIWQLWDTEDSSPFRSTDYQPEVIYVAPIPESWGRLPGGWRWRMAQLGVAHQSNGQGKPLSRSWNRIWTGVGFDGGEIGLILRYNQRLPESDDDNPDLVRHIGATELVVAWLPGRATASVTFRTPFDSISRGSLQAEWSYPVDYDKPAGLRVYVQLFSGYGETLLDYNHRQTSIGAGLTLFQF
jgi:phospholipase A1/A2